MCGASAGGIGSGLCVFFFQAEDGIRDYKVTGVQTCALPISSRSLQMSFSVDAVSSAIWRDSTTHGPAIRNKGLSRPASNPQSFMLSSRDRGLGLAGLVLQSGLDERREERMPAAGRRGEFRMELAADEPRV